MHDVKATGSVDRVHGRKEDYPTEKRRNAGPEKGRRQNFPRKRDSPALGGGKNISFFSWTEINPGLPFTIRVFHPGSRSLKRKTDPLRRGRGSPPDPPRKPGEDMRARIAPWAWWPHRPGWPPAGRGVNAPVVPAVGRRVREGGGSFLSGRSPGRRDRTRGPTGILRGPLLAVGGRTDGPPEGSPGPGPR